jgi:hypothetical protein
LEQRTISETVLFPAYGAQFDQILHAIASNKHVESLLLIDPDSHGSVYCYDVYPELWRIARRAPKFSSNTDIIDKVLRIWSEADNVLSGSVDNTNRIVPPINVAISRPIPPRILSISTQHQNYGTNLYFAIGNGQTTHPQVRDYNCRLLHLQTAYSCIFKTGLLEDFPNLLFPTTCFDLCENYLLHSVSLQSQRTADYFQRLPVELQLQIIALLDIDSLINLAKSGTSLGIIAAALDLKSTKSGKSSNYFKVTLENVLHQWRYVIRKNKPPIYADMYPHQCYRMFEEHFKVQFGRNLEDDLLEVTGQTRRRGALVHELAGRYYAFLFDNKPMSFKAKVMDV